MKNSAKRIADSISFQLNYDEEKSAVIAYGLLAIMQMTIILLYSIFFGLLTKTLIPCLLLYFIVGVLRKHTGGAHAGSMGACIAVSFLVISAGAVLSVYTLSAKVPHLISAVILSISVIIWFSIAYKYVPVDSPNKKITNPQKIKRLRTESFIIIGIIFICATTFLITAIIKKNNFYDLFWSIYIAVFWQIWTLTVTGRKLLQRFDRILSKFFK